MTVWHAIINPRDLITIEFLENTTTQPQRLQILITAAQNGDKAALLQLCTDFAPLLRSEAHREMFYKSLGCDAESIAGVAFIELILKYDGADFKNWPGYARCKVHFALFDAMEKQGGIWENEAQMDTTSEAVADLIDEACGAAQSSEMACPLLSLELEEALAKLDTLQRQVLTMLFIKDMKPAEAASRLDCTVRNVTKHRFKALAKLRELLAVDR